MSLIKNIVPVVYYNVTLGDLLSALASQWRGEIELKNVSISLLKERNSCVDGQSSCQADHTHSLTRSWGATVNHVQLGATHRHWAKPQGPDVDKEAELLGVLWQQTLSLQMVSACLQMMK